MSKPPIGVLGGGIIGITTGIVLLRSGYRVTLYAKELVAHSVSAAAGAMWLPIWASDPTVVSSNHNHSMATWSSEGWHSLQNALGKNSGVEWMTAREMFAEEILPPPYLASLLPGFQCGYDDRLPSGYRFNWSFTTLLIHPHAYLEFLLTIFTTLGGRIMLRLVDINNIAVLPEPILVNSLGLGARDFVDDPGLIPVKGQLVFHKPVRLQFIMAAGDFVVLPRRDALVLGSLFHTEYDDIEATEANTELIWDTISRWCTKKPGDIGIPQGALRRDSILGTIACLRPFRRQGPRVEHEHLMGKEIIHNYGHGGSGFTIGWGCANSVRQIVDSLVL
jgi:D-amino-acid oxidase